MMIPEPAMERKAVAMAIVEELIRPYPDKAMTRGPKPVKSSKGEFKRFENGVDYIVSAFPNFQEHLAEAQDLFNKSGLKQADIPPLLREAKDNNYFHVCCGADHHLILSLMNISGAWDSFICSPIFAAFQNSPRMSQPKRRKPANYFKGCQKHPPTFISEPTQAPLAQQPPAAPAPTAPPMIAAGKFLGEELLFSDESGFEWKNFLIQPFDIYDQSF
jgi:hypothetical protein